MGIPERSIAYGIHRDGSLEKSEGYPRET